MLFALLLNSILAQDNGLSAVSLAKADVTSAITVGGPWRQFQWGTGTPFATPTFDYFFNCNSIVEVTDAFCKGDRFSVFDGSISLGLTSFTPTDRACTPTVSNPSVAKMSGYSTRSFIRGRGTHSIRIRAIRNPFQGGAGFIRIRPTRSNCRFPRRPSPPIASPTAEVPIRSAA
jgi:hypothetical protein